MGMPSLRDFQGPPHTKAQRITLSDFIPFSLPDIGSEEIEAVSRALRSGWVTTGPECAAFEREFAAEIGGGIEAVAVNSATAGLHLALEAMGAGDGDEVIVPTWTFTATAEVVRYVGATPVVVDVDQATLNMDLTQLAAAITPRTKAVIVVHMAGLSLNMEKVRNIVGPDIRIIEDAAHAFPSSFRAVKVGACQHSDAAVFSFYANKTMTTGEGGMVTTRDPKLAARARTMRLHGIDRDVFDRYQSSKPSWAYDIVAPGFKYNLTDSAAAMGRVQLGRAAEMRRRRQDIAEFYTREFESLPIETPYHGAEGDVHAWHLYIIRVTPQSKRTRDDVVRELATRGVGTSVHFIPLHFHTYWRESLQLEAKDFPVASREFERVISVPLFSKMTQEQVHRVSAAIQDVLSE
jgi:dTDP-4-amino-4,6-dideoxygalactose transaminase